MKSLDPRKPAVGFRVSVRDGIVTYYRLSRPDPLTLGCVGAPDPHRFASASPESVDDSAPEGEPCDGAVVLRELDRAFRRREAAPWIPLGGVFLVWIVIAAVLLLQGGARAIAIAIVASIFATWVVYRVVRGADAAGGASLIAHDLDESSAGRYRELQVAAQKLGLACRMWHVASDGRLLDPKQKYGARRFLRRYRIRPGLSAPPRTLLDIGAPTIYGETRKYFFLPDRVLVYDDRGVRAVAYDRLAARTSEVLVVEDEDVPADARVVESTWLHLAADGGPDPAIANNRRYPIVLYGALELCGPAGSPELFHGSLPAALEAFAEALDSMAYGDEVHHEEEAESGDEEAPEGESEDYLADDLLVDSLRFLVEARTFDVGAIVSRFGVTFGRAARIVGTLEHEGFISPPRADGLREVRRSAHRYIELLDRSGGGASQEGSERKKRRTAPRRARGRRLEPHEVLGVAETASRAEIAEAYRDLAQLYHPDKVATLAPEFQDLADQRMKEINAAYTALVGTATPERRAGRR